MRHLIFVPLVLVLMSCGETNGDPGPAETGTSNDTPNNGGTNRLVSPVIVHPCDAISAADVESALGLALPESERSPEDDKAESCDWNAELLGRVSAVSVLRSNAQDFYDNHLEDEGSAVEVIDLPWAAEGSMIVAEDNTASLFAFIINTDGIGRDVYIQMSTRNGYDAESDTVRPIPIEDQKSALDVLGKQLSEATRAAQPDGVELPEVGE